MKKVQWISLLALGLLLISAGVAWSLLREDPKLAALRDLDTQMRASEEMTQEQREQIVQQIREVRGNLSEDQRRVYGQERWQEFRVQMQERMDQYFALSEENRIAFLDEEIDRQEARRREWEQRRKQREASGESRRSGESRGGRGGPPSGARGGRGARGGPGHGNATGMPDNERRMERRRRMLDATSPEERAKFLQFREDMQERRKQMGLPDFGWGHGRR